ncbi:MAG: rhodanese-like domain-containing protein [Balneolaceae bacterium]|nr:rhodanese-like domain-containing protein [Balneolaceae bacterium]
MDQQIKHYENKLAFEMDSADLHSALHQEKEIIVVDTRSSEAYEREHLPGAINIPHRTMSRETTRELDRDVLYVTYCDGIGCNASTKGARNMARLGFEVPELIGGMAWWKREGYPTEGFEKGSMQQAGCHC